MPAKIAGIPGYPLYLLEIKKDAVTTPKPKTTQR